MTERSELLARARELFLPTETPEFWGKTAAGVCGRAGTVYRITPQFTDRGAMSERNAERACAAVNAMPAALARIAELEAALQPFANACEGAAAAEPKLYYADSAPVAVELGACRRAWMLLRASSASTGGAS